MRSLVRPLVLAMALLVVPAGTAEAQQFGLESFTGMVFADDARDQTDSYTNTGTPGGRITDSYPDPSTGGTGIYELAGGHPYIGVTDFTFNRTGPNGPPAGGNVEELRVDIPRGLMPNPAAFDRCTQAQLDAHNCPTSSQIGTEQLTLHIGALAGLTGDIRLQVPLYNTTPLSNPEDNPGGPQRDVVARFAFDPAEAGEALAPIPALSSLAAALLNLHPVHIVGGVRDEPSAFGPFDYGLYFTIDHLPEYTGAPTSPGVVRTNLTFWGAPGDPAHDDERGRSCVFLAFSLIPGVPGTQFCTPIPAPGGTPDPDIPFLSNPTECTGQDLSGKVTVRSHPQGGPGGPVLTDELISSTPGIVDRDDGTLKRGAQECQQLTLAPAVDLGLDSPPQDSPVGPAVSAQVDQSPLLDRNRFAPAHAKDITVTLPPGLTINPSTANGLEACTDEQLAANPGVVGGDTCSDASRIGDVRVTSPLLPPAASDPPDSTPFLGGSAYVGQPLPGDKYRLFVTIEGREVSIRLKGTVRLDPSTGQVSAVFRDNPHLPFEDLTVDFRDGARAPLATPLDCEPKIASVTMSPWSGTAPRSAQSDPFTAAGSCPPGFSPTLGAAPASPLGGAITPFTATIARADGNQYMSSVRVQTPPGLAGYISKVDECRSAQAASGACPARSRIGTATTWAGSGPEPYRLAGPVYLTEGYKGGQFGMVTVIRAIAGPYDLGTVVVRQAIHVDPEDAHLTVISDPFPTILDGVPIRLRQVDLSLNTPGFSYNPTSCGAKQVRGTLYPVAGNAVDRTASFDLSGCERLGFTPKMSMQFVGPRQTRFEGHPQLRTRVVAQPGQANIGKVRVALPKAIALDPENSQKVCSVAAAAKADCPKSTRIGFAKAISPALDRPLQGPVYFVQGIRTDPTTGQVRRTLPSLLAKLRGQIAINLRGTTDVVGKNLVSDFGRVPDAPVSDFRLNLRGGRTGPLVISARRGICDRRQITKTQFTGQNGKTRAQNVNIRKPCRRPMLRLRRVADVGSRLAVAGTIRPKATKRLTVSVRCGGKRVARKAKRRGARWRTSLSLTGACASASKGKLRVSYPGGGDFRIAVRNRSVKLSPSGS